MNTITANEQYVLDILNKTECMTKRQAAEILRRYTQGINSFKFAQSFVDEMVKSGHCKRFGEDIASLNGYFDRKNVLLLDIAMKNLKTEDTLKNIIVRSGVLQFVKENVVYTARCINPLELQRLKLIDQDFVADCGEDLDCYKNLYIFDYGCDEKLVLPVIAKLKLKTPHMLCFNLTQDLNQEIKYHEYEVK